METRKSIRLENHDYSSQGCYFITICTKDRENLFWSSRRDNPCSCPPEYTALGKIAENTISMIEHKFSVSIQKYVVMPNHIHMLIDLPVRAGASPAPTLSQIVGAYKSLVANQWLQICKTENRQMGIIWQRSFHDHIIRDEQDYLTKWNYIDTNPYRWSNDEYYFDI